ncbi:type II toxin-antitoxin system HipA family toxin (plasmid) [Croceicoccus marinus]|uniref:Type II toxin-antitoxin system HipA family toxin n=2 Tax=Croceicoccus marinus TaxID=450378 RepID=A0A7G6W0X7_9SPHN|nr:type II toxin-antitoxin system HipA family toxin [Croceicoccus marinus]
MTSEMLDRLTVRWGDRTVGELAVDRSGAMRFAYAAAWIEDRDTPPVSMRLPKQEDPFGERTAKPFFDGLLPEEWQREAAARALAISPGNPFRLLKALGGDTAGALTFWPDDHTAQPADADADAVPGALSDVELARLFDRMAQRPMLAGEGRRYSLAGAQSKLPVVLDGEGRVALARSGQATTHIIKPEPARFARLAANEAYCLALAAAVGLDTAETEWRLAEERPYLLVRRYDRVIENGRTTRLHQEDFAQGLGVMAAKKYASDGGPVFRDCFALVRRAATDPERVVLKLIDAALFNLIIGNADAHAKNFSLLRQANGTIVLAPLYDLVATAAWPELSPRMAMKYGRARTIEDMARGSFERFAADAGLEFALVRERGLSLADRVIEAIEVGVDVPGLADSTQVRGLQDLVLDRAGRAALKLIL